MVANRYNPQNDTAVCDAGREDRPADDDRPDLTDDQRVRARKIVSEAVVGRLGGDRAELVERLLMLGIFPGQEEIGFEFDTSFLQVSPFMR